MHKGNRKRKKTEETSEAIIIKFSQINVRHQTTDPGNSENTKYDKSKETKQNPYKHIIFKLQKIKHKIKKLKKETKGEKHLTYRGIKTRITTEFS